MRSQDFERIHIEFCDYYKDKSKGDREYYDWINALSLDESKPYGEAKESFQWAKTMLRALREDADNKYYGVLVGLPIMSMNGNIYHERDLIAAALSLKGKHPSLNHKDAFWFNEANRYGVLTVVDAKYEDGAVEAVLQVPKSAVCPICDGASMTSLIDNQHIVNVSLEGRNNGAFEFTDPPFTLLTSTVLPGIPLARIKPLEKIMSEAFHSTKSTGNKKLKYEAKIIREDGLADVTQTDTSGPKPDGHMQCGDGMIFSATKGCCIPIDEKEPGSGAKPNATDNAASAVEADLATTAVGTPAVPDGAFMQSGDPMGDKMKGYERREGAEPNFKAYDPQSTKTNAGTSPLPPDERSGPTRSKPPERSVPSAGSLPSSVKTDVWTGDSPVSAGVKVGSATVEALPSLEERKAAIKANQKANSFEAKAIEWEQKHDEIYSKYEQLIGMYKQLDLTCKQAHETKEEAVRSMHNSDVDRQKYERLFGDEAGNRRKIEMQLQDTQQQLNMISRKYNDALGTNLELSKKLTQANEEYLEVAKKLESTDEALERSRIEAKKILKIRV
jgi:hypothetical protein